MEVVGAVIAERNCWSLSLFERFCIVRFCVIVALAGSGNESRELLVIFLSSFVARGHAVVGLVLLLLLLLLLLLRLLLLLLLLLLCENEPAVRVR